MTATEETTDWITGEEFAAERNRLREAGFQPASPEYQALLARVRERDEHIWRTYGAPLIEDHAGKWAALSLSGEAVICDSDLEAMRRGRERFGAGNFCLSRLDEIRGHLLVSPRTRP
jgi:hypothetical protein